MHTPLAADYKSRQYGLSPKEEPLKDLLTP